MWRNSTSTGLDDRPLSRRMHDGEKLVGAFVRMNDPQAIDALASAGLDFVIVDMEHGPIDLSSATSLVLAAGGRIGCVVRVPGKSSQQLPQILDLGPDAILFPHISSVDEAIKARSACRFPPLGTRAGLPSSLEAIRTHRSWAQLNAAPEANFWILIEDPEGFGALPDILTEASPDAVMLGMFDLALNARLPVPTSSSWDPRLIEFAEAAISACEDADVPACLTSQVPDAVQDLANRCSALFVGSDIGFIQAAAAKAAKSNPGISNDQEVTT